MKQIRLIWVGKTKEPWLVAGLAEYLGRLKAFTKLDLVELKPSLKKDPKQAVAEEAERILAALEPGWPLWVLTEEGQGLGSGDLAKRLEAGALAGQSRLQLVIGGAWGLGPEVKAHSDFKLSLSKMTFTHQMTRLFLLEQLYRAFTILAGQPYHNA
ncbi:MAG: hypothetical protein A2508_07395 [Candidatus Lambdaproteobacteria bacterium RIFOXYD12_FULL_49_8]|uniref:Ribosomal RNA large subunit methyltransferase H n=1 Tax=Candidatus Lambdaproteobacteria bacterium RIFOXYD2_FULL_50_16 TaxID=1817772 RepID=A0A1F6G9A8_9PROT|nr:MAG: hypothetical protein A2527_05525 [Candidatus Lambdaproteobacteria bacterium RIFOXYD2_FULL_50_16]OGG97410.1 MAG: hypothetical protein A2508_07395 [Candidatus Lambdaproteobacteria bacterium RIFOXYD12_FULL_49_8]